ncbi:MAG TPA: hypothetical protein VKU38_20405 [Ktedonobacteraceae bacterium]|nr:hypothetical protein [Ktedonobacteraceae bacterium]
MSHTHIRRSSASFSRSGLSLSLGSFLLVSLLSACSLGGGSTGTASPSTSNSTPATTPGTAVLARPTSAAAASMKSYTGDGFHFDYPAGWTVIEEGKGQVMIVNQQAGQAGTFDIGINPAGGKVPAAAMIQFALIGFMALPHYQKVAIAPEATVGGDSWDQIAATGDVQVPGLAQLVNYESVVIADVHPAASPAARGFEIRYTTDASRFAQMSASSFQPMLQSFTFA